MFPKAYTISFADKINAYVDEFVTEYGSLFESISDSFLSILLFFETTLRSTPWWVLVVSVMTISFAMNRQLLQSIGIGILLCLLGVLGLWDKSMQSLSLMVLAVLLAITIGIPVGIVIAKAPKLRKLVLPILDMMQTMPSFVYLVPTMMLFGLGKVPAIFATLIYALPPLIRLTDLGIRMVDREIIEAASAFGVKPFSTLINIELPLARHNIMAGINQTTMLSLSMIVIASMIGARGLGEEVLLGIQRLDVGRGLEAGIAIVILAIIMDRLTSKLSHQSTTEVALNQ